MTTVRQAIIDTRGHLGKTRDSLNRLNGGITDSATTATLELTSPMPTAGSVVELRSATASELAYVWAVSGQDLTLERGYDGSTAAAFSNADHVAIDPVVSYEAVYRAIRDELRSLPSEGLRRIAEASVTWDYTRGGIDTSAVSDLIAPLELQFQLSGVDYVYYRFRDWQDFLRPEEFTVPDSSTLTLVYQTVFTQPTSHSSDLATDCLMPASAQDVVAIGAAIRLVYSQEQLRGAADVQQHARGSEDVPPGSGARSVGLLYQWKQTRLADEQRRVREQYPRRRL